ncbi:MAG: NAD(P)/FAD-dependent oxidoreductase [Acidobacteriota bacterium]
MAILGGGLAGTAASIHLARAGLRVLCIEPRPDTGVLVGESLDWSAPPLLAELGFPMHRLIDEGIATYKKHVIVTAKDGDTCEYIPGRWLAQKPWNVEVRTLHVDRAALRDRLRTVANNLDIPILEDRVAAIESLGGRIISVTTASGQTIRARFYLDASGVSASLMPRRIRASTRKYGPQKVAFWNYFTANNPPEGTTIHAGNGGRSYMEWIWEIPINPNTIGVGYVAPADAIKVRRQQGETIEHIYAEALARIPRLAAMLPNAQRPAPHAATWRCRVHERITGENWIAIGESASMIDPLTSNGVTAALRHAQEAARIVISAGRRMRLSRLACRLYTHRAVGMARFFNCWIERVVYDWPIRERIGTFSAGRVYTVPAWLFNLFYTRTQPRGLVATMLFCAALATLRSIANVADWLCRCFPRPAVTCSTGNAS